MKILVLNAGSSTLRYQLMEMEGEQVLASGKFERIGEQASFMVHKANGNKIKIEQYVKNHREAMEFVLDQLTKTEYKVIDSLEEISAIGHRVVHGGENITESVVITDEILEELRAHAKWAPLHNPGAIAAMDACKEFMPHAPMVAVIDTTFHKTLSKERFMYGVPKRYYEKYGVRKYGFHGTSYRYVSKRIAEIEGTNERKVILCHLGSGSSICATLNGKSVDTSMGFTPNAGMPMVTRCGNIPPSLVTFLMAKENLSIEEIEDILSFKSGMSGLPGVDPDYRAVAEAAKAGNEDAALAIELFEHNSAAFIAEYTMTLGGVDTIVFTAGIAENNPDTRSNICKKLAFLGVEIDEEINNSIRGTEGKISTPNSKVDVYVIPTDEEIIIARDTIKLLQ